MKREEWEKSTGKKFVKERRKFRREASKNRATLAYYNAIVALGAYKQRDEAKPNVDASARQSDNAALAAILKFGRRFMPLYTAAIRELDRRYRGTQNGYRIEQIISDMAGEQIPVEQIAARRKELKRAYKNRQR